MASDDDMKARFEAVSSAVSALRKQLADERSRRKAADENLLQLASTGSPPAANFRKIGISRLLRGHFDKVHHISWAGDSRHCVSVAQDGKIIIWDAFSTHKLQCVALRSRYVMTCAFSQAALDHSLVAAGGLDDTCSVYRVFPEQEDGKERVEYPPASKRPPVAELMQHTGYISSICFPSASKVLTASGDKTCILSDLERADRAERVFEAHTSDVMSVAMHPADPNVFVSGGCDKEAKLWDIRLPSGFVASFAGHEDDINSVSFFPGKTGFATASDDATVRFFDIRAVHCVNIFGDDNVVSTGTSCSFSGSGKYIFAGYDDFHWRCWDTVTGNLLQDESAFDNRVSSVSVSPDGLALAASSWDSFIKIWA
eukprot:GABV01000328.1.p1 GENE.GABV01000328.1~~GABV01000328.1.p1  ORF type:complete len:370 (-),score=90.63 GABV01000328.1:224-1333(-)